MSEIRIKLDRQHNVVEVESSIDVPPEIATAVEAAANLGVVEGRRAIVVGQPGWLWGEGDFANVCDLDPA